MKVINNMFNIQNIKLDLPLYLWGHQTTKRAEVRVTVDAKYWTKLKKTGRLGQLYGIDISNEVYRTDSRIRASNPTVDDKKRASNGFKTIILYYETSIPDREPAKPALRLVK